MAVVTLLGLIVTGCGWSPPSAPPSEPNTCTPSDGPTQATVDSAISGLPPSPAGTTWQEVVRGNATNCRLYWVQVSAGPGTESLQEVLFFDRNTPLGTATPQPRPYTIVLSTSENTATVQYQWRQDNDPPCCPTGIGQVRFQIDSDGKLKALDPIPNP